MNVDVRDVEAGSRISIDVSHPETADNEVALDTITTDVSRSGGFTMAISNSRTRLDGSPEFDRNDGVETLQRIRLDHSISNDNVDDVTLTFQIAKDRLRETDTDPESVAMYRHEDGSWAQLETKLVGDTPDHYLLRARSPGMSEFAIGAQRPSFDLWSTSVTDDTIVIGESVNVSGRVSNVGSGDGPYEASLVVDGRVMDRKSVTIAKDGTRQVNFNVEPETTGTHRIRINGEAAGTVTVEPSTSGDGMSADGSALANQRHRWLAVITDIVDTGFGPVAFHISDGSMFGLR